MGFCLCSIYQPHPGVALAWHHLGSLQAVTQGGISSFQNLKMQVIPGCCDRFCAVTCPCSHLNDPLLFFPQRVRAFSCSAVLATSLCPTAAKQNSTQKTERLCCEYHSVKIFQWFFIWGRKLLDECLVSVTQNPQRKWTWIKSRFDFGILLTEHRFLPPPGPSKDDIPYCK